MKSVVKMISLIVIMCLFISCKKKNENDVDTKAIIESSESIVLSIDQIEDDYFLGTHPWASPLKYKVFAALDKDLCIGDYVDVYFAEMKEIEEDSYEISAKLVEPSDFELKPNVAYKPVIYLYPTEETKIFVTLDYNGTLTHTYPVYTNGWNVTAYPNGLLMDDKGNEYPYLFWEGESDIEYDLSKGFCVPGLETEQFLRTKLTFLGLNQKELEDFLGFWIPFMVKNPYNKITFQTTAYTDNATLTVSPEPDSILRIYMVFQPLNEFVEVVEQPLTKFDRNGFTLVEWGGSIIK